MVAQELKKTPETLKIYDPYYCNGRVVTILNEMGFKDVHNKCEDFYKVVRTKKVPEHDIVITNPPYSEDHMKKCFEFCVQNKKPWFILVPYFVYQNGFYKEMIKKAAMRPFYIVPNKKYEYITPPFVTAALNKGKEGDEHAFVPMSSFWHIDLGKSMKYRVLDQLKAYKPGKDVAGESKAKMEEVSNRITMAENEYFLPRYVQVAKKLN